MGLDMYVEIVEDDFFTDAVSEPKESDSNERFYYWRKHPNLHGWMRELYEKKGGTEEFNCQYVELTKKDILDLYKAIMKNKLPHTTGFFFGQSPTEKDLVDYIDQVQEDLTFIKKALEFFNDPEYEGKHLMYTSWW